MLTGLVREVGNVRTAGTRLEVDAAATAAAATPGDSVAVAGVCLTVVTCDDSTLAFDVTPETLARTTLGALVAGDPVNLEPALRTGDALGGHYVQGHVDGVGTVRRVEIDHDDTRVWFDAPRELLRYVAEKGSVAVDGTSLTIAGLENACFAVALVPHTLDATTLGALVAGDRVNLEVDVLAKYVERLLRS
jgi:riboflavin synthase